MALVCLRPWDSPSLYLGTCHRNLPSVESVFSEMFGSIPKRMLFELCFGELRPSAWELCLGQVLRIRGMQRAVNFGRGNMGILQDLYM